MADQIPVSGRIVQYQLTDENAAQINRRRTTGASIAERIVGKLWPLGAQAHVGADVAEGDRFPMVIVKGGEAATSLVNGQVFLDGNDVFWATSVGVGDRPGTFSWPTRV